MTELPRIPPTGPAAGIKAIKPVRKPGKEPKKRPQREPSTRKNRDQPGPDEHVSEAPVDDPEPGKGSSINLRV